MRERGRADVWKSQGSLHSPSAEKGKSMPAGEPPGAGTEVTLSGRGAHCWNVPPLMLTASGCQQKSDRSPSGRAGNRILRAVWLSKATSPPARLTTEQEAELHLLTGTWPPPAWRPQAMHLVPRKAEEGAATSAEKGQHVAGRGFPGALARASQAGKLEGGMQPCLRLGQGGRRRQPKLDLPGVGVRGHRGCQG